MSNQNDLSVGLLRTLAPDIALAEVEIVSDEETISRINASYPMGLGRIDWDRIPDSKSLLAKPVLSLNERLGSLMKFFEEFIILAGLAESDKLTVVGDGVLDVGIRLSVRSFRKYFADILSLPQHTYVVNADTSWCFNYTFEDDAFFGYAP